MRLQELMEFLKAEREARRVSPIRKALAFVERDSKIWWTYKLWISLDVLGTVTNIASYFLVSMIISPTELVKAGYGSSFLAFAAVGIAFQHYVSQSVMGLSDSINEEQHEGSIETVLSSTVGFGTFLLGKSLFRFIIASAFLASALATAAALGAGFTDSPASILSAAILSLLLVASHMAIGILSTGIIIKVKQGNPVVWAFSWLTQLFSGVLYPLSLLPPAALWIGALFPLTYSLDGLRRCLIVGETLADPVVAENALKLVAFTVAALPVSLAVFKKMYDLTRKEGSLGHY